MWFFLEHGLGPFETPARCVLKSSLTYSPWIWGGTNTQLLRILKSCWQIQADYGPLLAMTLLNHLQQWQAPQQCLDQFCSIDIDIGHTYIYINIYIYTYVRAGNMYTYILHYIFMLSFIEILALKCHRVQRQMQRRQKTPPTASSLGVAYFQTNPWVRQQGHDQLILWWD